MIYPHRRHVSLSSLSLALLAAVRASSLFWYVVSLPRLENLQQRFHGLDLPHFIVRKYAVPAIRVVREGRSSHDVDRRT